MVGPPDGGVALGELQAVPGEALRVAVLEEEVRTKSLGDVIPRGGQVIAGHRQAKCKQQLVWNRSFFISKGRHQQAPNKHTYSLQIRAALHSLSAELKKHELTKFVWFPGFLSYRASSNRVYLCS